jgi:hypothetical protein
MASVSTRNIGAGDMYDRVAIKYDAEAVNALSGNKWGIIKVTITSVTLANVGGNKTQNTGTVDLRAANFNENCDVPILDHVTLADNHTSPSLGSQTTFYCSVNNGVLVPSAFLQGDNTYDLMYLTLRLPEGNTTDVTATVNYTLTYTDKTQSSVPSSTDSFTLHVYKNKTVDQALLCNNATGFTPTDGYCTFSAVSLTTTAIDVPTDFDLPELQTDIQQWFAQQPDSVPQFTLAPAVTPWPGVMQGPLLQHPVTKNSGAKNYPVRSFMVFAMNGGKVDANGSNFKGGAVSQAGPQICFFIGALQKLAQWPCNEDVTAVFTYAFASGT